MTRKEAIYRLKNTAWLGSNEDREETEQAVDMAIEALRDEAVQGEWIEREDWNGDNYYDCSVCGESFVLYDGTPSMNLYHYCPNCGADMRGGKE